MINNINDHNQVTRVAFVSHIGIVSLKKVRTDAPVYVAVYVF